MKKLILILGLASCSHSWEDIQEYRPKYYRLYSEWYTYDTVYMNRRDLLWADTVFRAEEQAKLDTIKPRWWTMCAPDHLEKWYYLSSH